MLLGNEAVTNSGGYCGWIDVKPYGKAPAHFSHWDFWSGKFPVSGHQPNPTMRQLSRKREMINRVKLLVKVFKDGNGYDTPYCAYGGENLEPEHPRYFILLSGTS